MTTPATSPISKTAPHQKPLSIIFLGDELPIKLAYSQVIRQSISKFGTVSTTELTPQNWREFPEVTHHADVIFSSWSMPLMDEKFLDAFPRLRAVFYAAGTVKGFVTDQSYDREIIVCSAASANAIPVAEYTLSTVLLSLKSFWGLARQTRRDHSWDRGLTSATGTYRSVVGLVSLGAVGRSVAQMLSRFDMQLIAYDPFVSKEIAEELGVKLVSMEELFSQSDVVSLHAPWIPETENMVNERLLRLMKPNATFINTSRGAIVNESDLCRVLKERADLTAVLDVTWPEPPDKNSPLYTLDNVILTPHIAGSLGNEVTRMGDWMLEELRRYIEKAPLRHQVTREMLARMA